jgi:DNA-binding NtrC family response regulator
LLDPRIRYHKRDELIAEVERHYIKRALTAAHGNKSQAARLLGLGSYQTFTNWAKRCGAE